MQKISWIHISQIFQRKAKPFIVKYILIFVFVSGVLLGIGTKTLLNDVITIGYDDYKLNGIQNTLDLNSVQKKIIENRSTLATGEELPRGETCSE